MLSQFPDTSQRISLVSALAPITYNAHTQGMLRWCASFLTELPLWVTVGENFNPKYSSCFVAKWVLTTIWKSQLNHFWVLQSELDHTGHLLWLSLLCDRVSGLSLLWLNTYSWHRFDKAQQDPSSLVTQLQHFPSGTSSRTIVHFAQMMFSNTFQAFDWGEEGNILAYNSSLPTIVDLSSVDVPIAIYVAQVGYHITTLFIYLKF